MFSSPVFSQTGTTHHQQTWTQYYLNIPLNEYWSIYTDAGIRFEDGYTNHFQSFIRPSFLYQVSNSTRLALGYAYFFNDDNEGFEHRPFQDVFWNVRIASIELKTRFRFEQRYFHTSTNDYLQLRYRFRLTWEKSIYKREYWDFRTDANNEILLCTGERVAYNNIDQNRTYVGFRIYAKSWILMMGYQLTAVPGQQSNSLKMLHLLRQGIRYNL
jgi:hypothetical protein